MWVEGGDIHDELLDELGAVLAPPADLPLVPSAAEFEALAAAVSARWPGGADVAPAGAAPVRRLHPTGGRQLRRLGFSAWRAGSVAAAIVVFSASAAAAASGVPLPRPVRVVAYTVGLPVDSPALDDTNHHIDELKDAVKAKDTPKADAVVQRLATDLKKVPSQERKEAKEKIVQAVTMAQPVISTAVPSDLLPKPAPFVTTTTAPPSTTVTTQAADPGASDKPAKDKGDKDKSDRDKGDKSSGKGSGTTATTAPRTTTTTAGDPTTTTTVPSDETPPATDPSSGDPGTGSDPGAGGAGTGADPGTTTPTTAPDTTTTTAPAGGTSGGDPATTTTTTSSSTTTTTVPPADPGTGTNP
ncbi:MAG TPA: hypothetical protein VHL53_19050 [Acidimicrobiia bacterium]|nr:hypothetical protein [Acidimicrobiia bacterium]